LLSYLFIVLFGPRLTSNWKPFALRRFLVAYNGFLVVLNAYIFLLLCTSAVTLKYSLLCQHIVYSSDLASGLWWYYVSKIIELTDTIIFILRKKSQQLTFLHIYHHVTMPFWCWIAVRWFCGGSTFFIPTINSFVHIVMYTYYGLSAFKPNSKWYLLRKQLLTVLQLVNHALCCLTHSLTGAILFMYVVRSDPAPCALRLHTRQAGILRFGIWGQYNRSVSELLCIRLLLRPRKGPRKKQTTTYAHGLMVRFQFLYSRFLLSTKTKYGASF
uniref:Elongation of very long chain fatty acids protein n=2 Tax=Schistocephalus solidus TaxID=70667 RepID=A0A183SGM0_SCHSO